MTERPSNNNDRVSDEMERARTNIWCELYQQSFGSGTMDNENEDTSSSIESEQINKSRLLLLEDVIGTKVNRT